MNDWENVIAYWEEIEQRDVQVNKCGLYQIHLEDSGVGATQGQFYYFLLSFKLGHSIPST